VAGQPGLHLLVKDDLGVLMPGEAQGHDEDPRLQNLASRGIDELGTGAEVHLRGLGRGKVENDGRF
jgi:hypothetical protein